MENAIEKTKLGILAGGGKLPSFVIEACQKAEKPFFVLAFEGQAEREMLPPNIPIAWAKLGEAGKILRYLHEEGVTEVLMAGRVHRPSLTELKPDWKAAKFFARAGLRILGDNSLLSAIAKEFESEGFKVIGVQDIMPDMLAWPGIWGRVEPSAAALRDIELGMKVARTLGALDVGQAVVVQQGLVLGVEAVEGTDALIKRTSALQRKGEGGVLVKVRKPQQDVRVDLPTIGVSTIENCASSGLAGIAIEAGGALALDAKAVIEAANRLGLFIVGVNDSK